MSEIVDDITSFMYIIYWNQVVRFVIIFRSSSLTNFLDMTDFWLKLNYFRDALLALTKSMILSFFLSSFFKFIVDN